ncbi:MAG: hypothetical protein KAG10_10655 [Methylococcales bacterium]|nr:hypothetical protein [Methylococcales bacterium]MCK5926345.1 hypothetical protein [Methylococcales bacterium]
MLKIVFVIVLILILIGVFFLSGSRKKRHTRRIPYRRNHSISYNDSSDSNDCGGDSGGCDGGD